MRLFKLRSLHPNAFKPYICIVSCVTLQIFLSVDARAWDVSLSAYRLDDKVQDDRGDEAVDPVQPAVSVGHTFDTGLGWFDGVSFSPRFGYAKNLEPSRDSYGQQKVETVYFLYDFITPVADSLNIRYGVGTFLKRVSGDGGTVTIPNGGSTATAYRPSGTQMSSTASVDLGLDYGWPGSTFSGYRIAGELHAYQILDPARRWIAYQLSFGVTFE